MKAAAWRDLIVDAVRRDDVGDPDSLDLLAQTLEELDEAKQRLRDAGYGVTGTPLQDMVRDVLHEAQ